MVEDIKNLKYILNYEFQNSKLLESALSHRSYSNENNERLEFLGDSILNMVIALELFKRFPNHQEGELTRMRAKLVRGDTLAELAREFELGNYIKMSPAELRSGGSERDSILADSIEAIIGSIYLDAGFDAAQRCIVLWFGPRLEHPELIQQLKDPKTELQEFLQGRQMELPEYTIDEITGEAHDQIFKVSCHIKGIPISTTGVDTTRRRAEKKAAEEMFERIRHEI